MVIRNIKLLNISLNCFVRDVSPLQIVSLKPKPFLVLPASLAYKTLKFNSLELLYIPQKPPTETVWGLGPANNAAASLSFTCHHWDQAWGSMRSQHPTTNLNPETLDPKQLT